MGKCVDSSREIRWIAARWLVLLVAISTSALSPQAAQAQPAPGGAPDPRPVMLTRLEIKAGPFQGNIDPASLKQIEDCGARALAAVGDEWFPHFRWVAFPDFKPDGGPTYWIAVWAEGRHVAHLGRSEIALTFGPGFNDQRRSFVTFVRRRPLEGYGAGDLYEVDNAPLLLDAIVQSLRKVLDDELDRQRLEADFLSRIPLAEDFNFDGAVGKLFVPLLSSLIWADAGSELVIKFKAQTEPAPADPVRAGAREGIAEIVAHTGHFTESGPFRDHLQAEVREFNFLAEKWQDKWRQDYDRILQGRVAATCQVLMKRYRLDPARARREGPILLAPDRADPVPAPGAGGPAPAMNCPPGPQP